MRLIAAMGIVCLAAMVLTGCGGGVAQNMVNHDRPTIQETAFNETLEPAANAQATEVTYRGGKALQLSNGLVTAIISAAAGGRIMEYKLGSHSLLWAAVATAAASQEPGGGVALAGAPIAGAWTARVITARGPVAEVQVASPADPATGLQITRTLKLYAGTTRLQVTDTVKNTGDKPTTVSLRSSCAIPGALSAPDKPSDLARVYFPASMVSGKLFWNLSDKADASSEVTPAANSKTIQIANKGIEGGIAASAAGWVAGADDLHEYMLVQRFTPDAGGQYPNGGANIEVATYAAGPYMLMSVLAPQADLKPGEAATLCVDWYATRMSGAPSDVTEMAAIRQPLALEKSGDQLVLTGELGAFAPAALRLSALNTTSSQPDRELDGINVKLGPDKVCILRQPLNLPADAGGLAVSMVDARGAVLGETVRLALKDATSAKPVLADKPQ